jgi:2-C-methyl-D-erythritol 2,4-cyclodiphosphate synthase
MNDFRIGQGFDVHSLCQGRPMIIGGTELEYVLGLDGHSDADVLSHAIIDALLGAIGRGDIGHHFPDNDPRWKDADSLQLLSNVVAFLQEDDWQIINVDTTIIAQAPKMAPYIPEMITHLSRSMKISRDRVNIKATTTEKLGYTGRGEGIAAMAVVLIGTSNP